MEKDKVVSIMLESINSDNRQLCKDMGMSEEDAETQIEQSQLSLGLMLENVYDTLVKNNLIVE
jgi:hypothetical protein